MKRNINKEISIIEIEFNSAENGINYKDIKFDDKTLYNWKCTDCNEIWETSNYQRRIAKKGNCLYCTNQKVRKTESLGYLHPELIIEWSDENEKDIYNRSIKYYEQKVKWICQDCNNPYEQKIPSRIKGSGCLCKKDILSNYPNLAIEIQNADPSKITIGTHDMYEWKCQVCEYTWKEEVNKRVNGNSKCPKCHKRKAIEGNTLADTHRHLMDEWDFEKNTISPFKVTSKNYSEIIFWKCEEFPDYHKWPIKLGSRVSKTPTGCPYCSGNKTSILESIVSDRNEYRNELLAKEFDKEKNTFKIEEIRAGSQEQIWWKCSNDECDYEWQATPANRTGTNKTGCRVCSSKKNKRGQSNHETNLRDELKLIFDSVNEVPKPTHLKFASNQPITVDFYIEELSLAFDLDPNYTHKEEPSESYNRDKEKTEILKNYCNFFKLRQDPLTKISVNDIVYNCPSNNSKELATLIYKKILELYPNIDKDTKSKLLKLIN